MTLFDRVFSGNDAVYGLTEGAIDAAIAQHGEDKAVSFPDTAYSLPCYYSAFGKYFLLVQATKCIPSLEQATIRELPML